MLSKLDKITDLANEFGTPLLSKMMGWFYANKNSDSPVQPDPIAESGSTVKSWIGYDHTFVNQFFQLIGETSFKVQWNQVPKVIVNFESSSEIDTYNLTEWLSKNGEWGETFGAYEVFYTIEQPKNYVGRIEMSVFGGEPLNYITRTVPIYNLDGMEKTIFVERFGTFTPYNITIGWDPKNYDERIAISLGVPPTGKVTISSSTPEGLLPVPFIYHDEINGDGILLEVFNNKTWNILMSYLVFSDYEHPISRSMLLLQEKYPEDFLPETFEPINFDCYGTPILVEFFVNPEVEHLHLLFPIEEEIKLFESIEIYQNGGKNFLRITPKQNFSLDGVSRGFQFEFGYEKNGYAYRYFNYIHYRISGAMPDFNSAQKVIVFPSVEATYYVTYSPESKIDISKVYDWVEILQGGLRDKCLIKLKTNNDSWYHREEKVILKSIDVDPIGRMIYVRQDGNKLIDAPDQPISYITVTKFQTLVTISISRPSLMHLVFNIKVVGYKGQQYYYQILIPKGRQTSVEFDVPSDGTWEIVNINGKYTKYPESYPYIDNSAQRFFLKSDVLTIREYKTGPAPLYYGELNFPSVTVVNNQPQEITLIGENSYGIIPGVAIHSQEINNVRFQDNKTLKISLPANTTFRLRQMFVEIKVTDTTSGHSCCDFITIIQES